MKKMLKYTAAYFLLSILGFHSVTFAHELPTGFAAVQLASGLDPVAIALAPDGRIFFTEKSGRVRIVENGIVQVDPFLEIEVDNFNERGLSGIAVDPEFESNHFVYVYYTVPNASHNRLSRFTANGNFAEPGSETILLEFDPLAGNNHNAGAMSFGPDGKLYIATGDGTFIDASQSLNSLLGKILRINKDGSFPTDNPFYNVASGKYKAIWSLGHRNPFALTIDPVTGRTFTTDVGSHRFEEINEIFGGANYGWPFMEGDYQNQTPPANYEAPLHFYNHDVGCAAVGVTKYSPTNKTFPPEFWDLLFFSDYCSGEIKTLNPNTGDVEAFASGINRPLQLLTHPDGTMYFLAREGAGDGSEEDNTAANQGTLWRIFYTGSDAPFIAVQPATTLVSVGEQATFSIAASGALPLEYQWQIGSSNVPLATSPEFIYENAMLSDSGLLVRCIVKNSSGADTSSYATLQVTSNQRPQAEIFLPPEGSTYKAGDTLIFAGIGMDAEDGILSKTQMTWKIDFLHNEHTHPAYGPVSGIIGDSIFIPQIGETSDNVKFRITLTVTDTEGLSSTVQRQVLPVKSNITVKTLPSGYAIDANGTLSNTPFIVPSVVGVQHDFNAPLSLIEDDSVFVFSHWSTGETYQRITFIAPQNDAELIANYVSVQSLSGGQGLKGTYYNDALKNFTFQEPAVFSRVDPVIDFDWALGTPDETYLGEDYFLVRWEGFIQPLFSDSTHFHLITNDGSRLWVNNELLIDAWYGQGENEYMGSILLEKEKFYPIKLEYFEGIGDATVKLLWSGKNLDRSIVPSSQLFPALLEPEGAFEKIQSKIYPNPVDETLYIEFISPSENTVQIEVLDSHGRSLKMESVNLPAGTFKTEINFNSFLNGVYFVKLSGILIDKIYEIIHH